MTVFSVEDRKRIRERVLELAAADARIVAGAVVGSLALGGGDRWSDLDLTFGVADGIAPVDVLDDWTLTLVGELDAVHLFDVSSGPAIYRVFLLPGCLQCDLSFAPASAFGAGGPRFELLFGTAIEKPYAQPPAESELLGYAVHHALRARFCIERGRYWQAEYWISGVRDNALSLACRRRDLLAVQGRGYDDLPVEVRDGFVDALVHSLDRAELMRALGCAVTGLRRVAVDIPAPLEFRLQQLTGAWDDA